MKRLLAILLVICMAVSLIACGGGGNTTDPTGTKPSGDSSNTDKPNSGDTGNTGNTGDKPFAGKELQLWGLASETYNDISNMGRGNYIWMVRAAVDEWAYLNDVTVKYVANYDQTAMLGAMNSGEKPDLLIYAEQFPAVANVGVVRALTEEEYNTLAAICGNDELDVMKYKGDSYGVRYPWAGSQMFYYNETLFENAGVKSPKEYFLEGNWTWETLETCMREITMDTDGDGMYDILGMERTFTWMPLTVKEDPTTGELINIVDSNYSREFFDMLWNGILEGTIDLESKSGAASTDNPRAAMNAGDCEPYNYQHLDKTNSLGERIIALPQPVSTSEPNRVTRLSQAFMAIPKNCDESEAVLSLMSYILKFGLTYMEQFSVGLFETEWDGILGASEYSAAWKEIHDMVVEERKNEFAALDFDMDFYNKYVEEMNKGEKQLSKSYPGLANPFSGGGKFKPGITTPPASSVAVIKELMQADIDTYNNLYIN